MDAAQFTEMMKVMKEVMGGNGTGGKGGQGGFGGEREHLNFKVFQGVDKFTGDDSKWKEWFFNFKIAFNSHGGRYKQVLSNIETDKPNGSGSETIARWRQEAEKEGFTDWFDKVGNELFSKLCLLSSGEGNMLIRSTEGENGWLAFKRLIDRYDGKKPNIHD